MRTPNFFNRYGIIASLASLLPSLTVGTIPAFAADGVKVQTFSPTGTSRYTLTENALPERPVGMTSDNSYRRYLLSVHYNYFHAPLVELDPARTTRLSNVVESLQTLDLTAGIDWNGVFALNFNAPLNLVHLPGQVGRFALGDARVFSKFYLFRDSSALNVALIPEMFLPTGDTNLFVSDGGRVGAGVLLAFEHDFGGVSAAFNMGYRYNPGAVYRELNYKQKVPLSFGLNIPLGSAWAINTEASGFLILPINHYTNPSEFYGGLKYRISDGLTVSLGASAGAVFNKAAGSDYRVLAGLKFFPFEDTTPPPPPKVEVPVIVPPPPPKPEPPRVVFTPKEIQITEEVKFAHNSDVLLPAGKDLLNEVADVIQKNKGSYTTISIEGHTNEIGTDEYNLGLSRRRAASVKRYLIGRGVAEDVLTTIGYGKRRPKISTKDTSVSKAKRLAENRRVEFKVIK